MEVYIEYVIIDNFVMDMILIYLTVKVLGERINKLGLVLGSIFGSAVAVFLPFLPVEGVLFVLIKVVLGVLIIFLGRLKIRRIFAASILFFLLTFVFGGALVGLMYILKSDFVIDGKFGYIADIPIGLLFGTPILVMIFLLSIYKRMMRAKRIKSFIYDVELFLAGKRVKLKAYLDSGNFLFDYGSEKAVLVTYYKAVFDFLGDLDFFKLPKLKYSSAGGVGGQIRLKEIDEILIYEKDGQHTHNNIVLGLVMKPLTKDNSFELLLSPTLFET